MTPEESAREQIDAVATHLAARREALLQRWREAADADPELTSASVLSRAQFFDPPLTGAAVAPAGVPTRGHVGLPLDHVVALAGPVLQARPIQHRDAPTAVADQACALQFPGGLRDPFAAHPEHVGDQLLRHRELVRGQPIEAEQQPAAELLVDRTMPVADRRLRHLRQQRLRIAQQQMLRRPGASELALQQLPRKPERRAGALHDGAARGGLTAHEEGNTHHALVADHGDLGGRTILHDVEEGHDRGRAANNPRRVCASAQRVPGGASQDTKMKIIQTHELERLVRQTFPQKGFFSARAELDGSIQWLAVLIRTSTSISTRGSAARRGSFRPIK